MCCSVCVLDELGQMCRERKGENTKKMNIVSRVCMGENKERKTERERIDQKMTRRVGSSVDIRVVMARNTHCTRENFLGL
jgi:hypothetical protein